jgi:hypothetical protein
MPGVNHTFKLTINKSRRYSLALLCICQRIKEDIGSRWLGWILFNFQSPESLLDILTELPTTKVAAIRHVRVSGRCIALSLPHIDVLYGLASVLKLVPQLQLDTLTVLGTCSKSFEGDTARGFYETLNDLVALGNGWNELHYVHSDSYLLSFPENGVLWRPYLRKPQPDAWRQALYRRDGPDSGASVTIYRSSSGIPGSILQRDEQELFEQHVAPQDLEGYALECDSFLSSESERQKEILVVVKRGRGAKVTEEMFEPWAFEDETDEQSCDIRALALDMTWSHMRENYNIDRYNSRNEYNVWSYRIPNMMVTLDAYHDPYEIDWESYR